MRYTPACFAFVREAVQRRASNPKNSLFKTKPSADLVVRHNDVLAQQLRRDARLAERSRRNAALPRWVLWGRRLLFLCAGVPTALFLANVALSMAVHELHTSTVDAYFSRQNPESMLALWEDMEPLLKEGDLVLLYGTGPMSWRITNAQLFYASVAVPAAMRYSHVGVIVSPAVYDPKTHERLRGALMLEAVDNKDVHAPDHAGVVRHDCVQIVEADRRIFGKEGERRCYSRCAVRRFGEKFVLDPERRAAAEAFVEMYEGRFMEKSPAQMLNFISPRLYERTGIKQRQHEERLRELREETAAKTSTSDNRHSSSSGGGGELVAAAAVRDPGPIVSCGELVADYLKAIGVLFDEAAAAAGALDEAGSGRNTTVPHSNRAQRHRVAAVCEQLTGRPPRSSIQTAPFHFAELGLIGSQLFGLPWIVAPGCEERVYIPA